MFKKDSKKNPLVFFTILLFITTGCFDDTSTTDPTINPSSNPTWQNVFTDTFTRSDTVDKNIGSNWTAQISVIKILSNELYCSKAVSPSDDMGTALYTQSITDNKIRITTKFRTNSYSKNQSFIWARSDISLSNAYVGCVDNTGKCAIYKVSGGVPAMLSSTPYTLLTNTTYIFEFVLDGSSLTFNVKNATGDTIIETVTTTDSSYTTGYAGLMGGEKNEVEQPIYFSSFKIEAYK